MNKDRNKEELETIKIDHICFSCIPSICLSTLEFSHINGLAIPARTSAPVKVRGTTPGKVKWSYSTRKVSGIFDVGIPYVKISWIAWILKDSSTLV
jgi:hypothetical protein